MRKDVARLPLRCNNEEWEMSNWTAHILIGFAAIYASTAMGYEIPFGEGTEAGETDFYIVPTSRDTLTLKYASIPLIKLTTPTIGDQRIWTTSGRTAIAKGDSKGDITLRLSDFMKAGPAELDFKDGHLRRMVRDSNEEQHNADLNAITTHPEHLPTLPQLWRKQTKEEAEKTKAAWWQGDGRLRLGYFNPNAAGTLFAQLAALFAALAFLIHRRFAQIAFAGGMLISLYGLFVTGSRGSFIAWLSGIVLMAVFRLGRKMIRPKTIIALLSVIVIAIGVMFAASIMAGGRFGTNLLSIDAGNIQRLRAWMAAPEMMATAPSGWGEEPGRAYCDWFQDTNNNHKLYYLVNSHLTWLVQYGRAFRCSYTAAWLLMLAILMAFASSKPVATALSVCSTFATALWFSTVGIFPTLWILPGICATTALVIVIRNAMRNRQAFKTLFFLLCASAITGGILPFALEAIGRNQANSRAIPVSFDGCRITLGRGDAKIAILRDDTVLAGNTIGCFGHELRDWLGNNPNAGGIIVTDNPESLPKRIECLVAAGMGGSKYFKHRDAHLGDGEYCLADKTVLISPPFSPSVIPYTFLQRTNTMVIIGEFAARLSKGYGYQMPWVKILPGAELYIPKWPELAFAKTSSEGGAK